MEYAEVFSKNLKKYRTLKGLSQAELAKILNVSPQSISKWETGKALADVLNLCALAYALGVSTDILLFEGRDASQGLKHFVAIDGGATKTEAVLFTTEGNIIKRIVRQGCNPNVIGMDECVKLLGEVTDEMKSTGYRINGLFAGIAGSGVGDNAKVICDYLKKNHCSFPVSVCSDSSNVISSVRGCLDGISVIWGTGFTVTVHKEESIRRFAGWGYLFDEYASGYAIGRAVLMHCLKCYDLIEKRCLLTDMAEEKLGGEINDKLSYIYSMGKDYIASFARIAFDAYKKGDKTAQKIVRESIIYLADTVNHALKETNCEKNVVISGGLTAYSEILNKILNEKLISGVKVMIPELPQIYGACLSCLNLCKMSDCATEEFEENFKKDYYRN